jgi:hypothetical protein
VTDPPPPTWEELLEQAASRCDLDADAFVRAAWNAYLEARPGMRDYIEEKQLRTQLAELRKSGRIARA